MTIIDLIKLLEEAGEPGRELDREIWRVVVERDPKRRTILPAYYTRSFDAALTLLRPHYLWEVKRGIECKAIVWYLGKDWDGTGAPAAVTTEYPALALATAAIICRAVEGRQFDLKAVYG